MDSTEVLIHKIHEGQRKARFAADTKQGRPTGGNNASLAKSRELRR